MKLFPPVTVDSASGEPGTVLSAGAGGIAVACGIGSIVLQELQAEGRKRMNAAAFLAGRPLAAGERLA